MRGSWRSLGMLVVCAAVSLAGGQASAQTQSNATVLGTLAVADEGEIAQAQYAAQHATRADVRAFARDTLVPQHTHHLQMVRDTAAALGITLDTSSAQQLAAQLRDQLQQLHGVSGAALDSLFLVFMVQDHSSLQGQLDTWIQGGQNPQILPFLQGTRVVVHQHLVDAENLQQVGGRQSMGVHKDTGY